MFSPRRRPLIAREEQLRSLRLTLNTPELMAGEMPAGPARAAIAVHDDPDGSLRLTVVVQSLGTGTLVCWSWEGGIEPATIGSATDAALSFCESMGFLFDDDVLADVTPEARERAVGHWSELVGGFSSGIDESIEELSSIVEADALSEDAAAPAERFARESLPLTKFRRRLGPPPIAPAAPEAKPQASALGRLRLVKRARSAEAGERPPRWLRLLGSF
jgi:hypothetical protein